MIQAQERSIAELLAAVREQSEQLNHQRGKIKNLEEKVTGGALRLCCSRWTFSASAESMLHSGDESRICRFCSRHRSRSRFSVASKSG